MTRLGLTMVTVLMVSSVHMSPSRVKRQSYGMMGNNRGGNYGNSNNNNYGGGGGGYAGRNVQVNLILSIYVLRNPKDVVGNENKGS